MALTKEEAAELKRLELEEELERLELEEANAQQAASAPVPATAPSEPGILRQAFDVATAPLPLGIGRAVEAVRTDIPGLIAEKTGELAASAGPVGPAISAAGIAAGGVIGLGGELIPKTPLDVALLAAAGPAGKQLGKLGATLLPPIEKRAPNAVRAVRAALSANILPTIPQVTQSQAFATAEEITARIPFFGRRIKAMRQAQETAYQSLRTAAVKAAGPSVPVAELGGSTTRAIAETLESTVAKREAELAKLHQKVLRSGGDPTTAEAAARQLDDIRIANVEAARKTAGKHYDELAEMIPEDADSVMYPNALSVINRWNESFKNLPQAKKEAFSPLSRGLLADLEAGPRANVIENIPIPTVSIQDAAAGITSDAARALAARKSYTFQEIQTLRATINSGLHQARLKGADREVAMLSDLKRGLDLDIKSFGKSLQGDLSDKFKVATAYYKDIFRGIYRNETVDTIGKVAKENPQAVFDMLIGKGNIVDIKVVKAAVGEPGFAPMRRLAIERMVTSPEGRILSGPEITRNIASYSDEALKEILTPKQLVEVSMYRANRELPQFVKSEMEKKLRGLIFEREGVFRAPEDVVNRIISGDTATLKAVKGIVGEKGTDQYRRRIIEDIIGEAHRPELLPGQVQEKTALKIGKALREYDQTFLNEIFSPKAMAEIEKIDDIKALLQSQPRLVAAPGTTPAAAAILGPAAGGALFLISPVKGTAALIAAEIVTRFYISEAGRRLMIEGLDPRFVKNLPLYTRIITAAANATRDNAKEDRINRGVNTK